MEKTNKTKAIDLYSKETVALIRKHIKSKCKTLKVRQGRGTAGSWIDIDGSADEHGTYTPEEQEVVYQLGLLRYQGQWTHGISISPEERMLLVARLGLE